MLALNMNSLCPPFCSCPIPTGCGLLLGIELTTQLGAYDVFHLSTLPFSPSADASVDPMHCGSPGMSLYILVGRWYTSLGKLSLSSIVSASSEAGMMLMVLGGSFRAVLSGLNIPLSGWDVNGNMLQPSHYFLKFI